MELALAHVNAHARVQAERLESVDDRLGTPDRPRGSVERREEAVSGRVLLDAVEPAQFPPHERVMTREQVAPAAVTERRHVLGGADDVGEHHGGQHPLRHCRWRTPTTNSSISSTSSGERKISR